MEDLLRLIRDEIRSERPYLVGGFGNEHCKLNQNECPFDLPDELKSELLAEFERIPFNRYPAEQPFELMKRLEERHGLAEGSVLVGNGSNDLTQTLGLCLVSRGTRVALPRPMFALFESVVRMHAGRVISVPSGPDFRFNIEAVIEAAHSPDTALTIVASPNNPTGLAVPFPRLLQLCREASGFVVIDEAYQEFNSEPSVVPHLRTFPNLIVMRTLSKVFGLAGLRLGYMMGHPSVMAEFLKARIPFMVDRLSERTALAMLDHDDLIRERVDVLRAGIRSLSDELSALGGVTVLPTTTNFLLFRTNRDAKELASELARRGVVIRSMSGYGELKDFLRVNAGTEPENKAFIAALKQILENAD